MGIEAITPPTKEDMRLASGVAKTAAREWGEYSQQCERRFKAIQPFLSAALGGGLHAGSVLDWGCSVGGVAMRVAERLDVQVTAADVDRHALAWLRRVAPQIRCAELEPGQVLPFDDGSFDFIYGISVLTHIPPDLQEFYVAELARVVRAGGTVLLTFKGYASCDFNLKKNKDPALHPHDRDELQEAGILYREYPAATKDRIEFAQRSSWGITHMSPEYVAERFGRLLPVVQVIEGGLGAQDIVVMRKP